jgi:uncharacterized protein YgiM (DUF1202 family)
MQSHRLRRRTKRPPLHLFALLFLVGALVPEMATAETDLTSGTTAVIANANGDRVRLRAEPGPDGEVRALLPEGSAVLIETGPDSGGDGSAWYEVVTRDGTTGYVAADFISAGSGGGEPVPEPLFATTTDTVNLRAGPSLADVVLDTLDQGTTVSISGESLDGWFAVSIGQTMGFIHGDYLTDGAQEVDAKAGPGTRYTLDRVRLRTGPSTGYRTIDILPVGVRLDFTGDVQGSYAKVTSSYGNGWVAAQYIGPQAPSGASGGGGTRYTIDTVNLRTGPSTSYRSLAYLPVGVKLSLSGDSQNGFVKASTSYGTGWVYAQYIGSSAPASGGTGYTNDRVSLRTGPSSNYGRITTLSTGAKLTLTGSEQNGYSKVTTSAGTGWVASSYISSVAPQYTGGTRYTIDSVNLRRSPGLSGSVIRVVPSRTTITFTGTVVNNYGKVATSFGDGWISIDYFRKTRPSSSAGSLVVWPVKGGEWYVSQGYNGSSHQNETKYWQYYYAFDLKRSSGSTAWQPVYAPVDGRIRWIDESTGGMSVYMGDGLAFAMFHVLWANNIREGQTIRQGQYLGVIAPAGVANSGSSAHIHITAWTTSDEGNWSRHAQPFTGRFAIEGSSFPSRGNRNDYLNYTFNP